MRLLVVEDEERYASGLRDGLEAEGFAVDVALDGGGAQRLYQPPVFAISFGSNDWWRPMSAATRRGSQPCVRTR
ncbi:hypothetical protein ACIBAG_09955 [Streptomyces sp. NPDC051243]|uniref:hypothetical protein n=1 Tax=Streptomyces sp. NPDC051243 TaxID=3365646 RepID=UPI00378DEC17